MVTGRYAQSDRDGLFSPIFRQYILRICNVTFFIRDGIYRLRVKIFVGDLSGIKSPLGMVTGRNFLPATGNGAGMEGGDVIGDEDGDYAPSPTRPVTIPTTKLSFIELGFYFDNKNKFYFN